MSNLITRDTLLRLGRFYRDEFLLGFCRYIPLLLSLSLLLGLMLRQIGGYFGVPYLIDYNDPFLHNGSVGFAMMIICLFCLYTGFLLQRVEHPKTLRVFWKFAVCIMAPLCVAALAIALTQFPRGVIDTLLDWSLWLGVVLAGVFYWGCAAIGAKIPRLFHLRPKKKRAATPVSSELLTDSTFVSGAIIILGCFIVMVWTTTLLAAVVATWAMYVSALLLIVLFLGCVVRGPTWFRARVLYATGAYKLFNNPSGAKAVWTWLTFFVFSQIVLCTVSLIPLPGASPITSICSLWLSGLAGYVFFRQITLRTPALLAVGLAVLLLSGGWQQYRYRLDDQVSYDAADLVDLSKSSESEHNTQLKQPSSKTAIALKTSHQPVQFNRVIPPTASDAQNTGPNALLDIEELSFLRWEEQSRPAEARPMVVIAVSGGGMRSAAWTYAVLRMLDAELASKGVDFPSHARVICGASGGMLGAAFYVANLEPFEDRKDRIASDEGAAKDYFDNLTKDCLTPLINTLVFHDVPFMLSPVRSNLDRGLTLQNLWKRIPGATPSPLTKTFATIRAEEKAGEIPSLVFTPMIVEDGRRLLISNLDLRWVARNNSRCFRKDTTLSAEALELFRLRPKDKQKVSLATAARLSASFPYFSPPATLPTKPRRRVVDAGYYDNFGVSLAASWLFSGNHQNVFAEEKVGRVLFIQIRDGTSEPQRKLEYIAADGSSLLNRATEEITTPLVGFYNGQNSSSSFRNDGLLELLSQFSALKDASYSARSSPSISRTIIQADPGFRTLTIEYSGNASLSWYLTEEEKQSIRKSSSYCGQCEIDESAMDLVVSYIRRGIDPAKIRDDKSLLPELRQESEKVLKQFESLGLTEAGSQTDRISSLRISQRVKKAIEWWTREVVPTKSATGDSSQKVAFTPFATRAKIDSRELPEVTDSDWRDQVQRFTMGLRVTRGEEDIEKVTYVMNHPSFLQKELIATPGGEWRASYYGWGSLDRVTINIQLKGGEVITQEFNQTRAVKRWNK